MESWILRNSCKVNMKPFTLKTCMYSKTCVKQQLSKRSIMGFQDKLWQYASQKYCRMLQEVHSAILSTFNKLPFVIKVFVLSIWVAVLHRFYCACIKWRSTIRSQPSNIPYCLQESGPEVIKLFHAQLNWARN